MNNTRQNVEAIIRHAQRRAPKGWRLVFRVSADDLTDAYRISGFTHRDNVFGEALGASYREAHVVTKDLRTIRGDGALVDEVIRCVDLVMTYLSTARPAFRIGTKPSAKRLVLGTKRRAAP